MGAVSQHHLALTDIAQQLGCGLNVVGLTRRDNKLHRQTIIIGQSMNFCSKTSPASSNMAIRVAFFKVAAE